MQLSLVCKNNQQEPKVGPANVKQTYFKNVSKMLFTLKSSILVHKYDIVMTTIAACCKCYFFLTLIRLINNAGSSTKLVNVAVTSVSEVSQPNACVPPKPLKLKIIKPAISTNDV